MNEIKVLDKSVFNRIAAGEVVDRPFSIVKELIENSIDAGATAISIAVKGGGVKMIRISDNGKGIAPEFVKTAFLPHATSKISTVDDLDSISTLGFRGEALPSIASVAKVTMVTRTKNSQFGCRYVVDNGNEVDYGEMGAPLGTTVTVEDLFDRIPARKKFLSKDTVEENAITNLVARYVLSKPNISIKYTLNDRIVYNSSGEGVKNAINSVYGAEYLGNMLEIHSTMSDITLSGFINKPAFTKHSKAFQTLVVNGRYVINEDISFAIFGCYQKYLMKRQYPTYVLYLDLPFDLVDVNVHPNKMEVRFAIPQIIKKMITDAVKEQLSDAVGLPKDIDERFIFNKEYTNSSIKSTFSDGFSDPFNEKATTLAVKNADISTSAPADIFKNDHVSNKNDTPFNLDKCANVQSCDKSNTLKSSILSEIDKKTDNNIEIFKPTASTLHKNNENETISSVIIKSRATERNEILRDHEKKGDDAIGNFFQTVESAVKIDIKSPQKEQIEFNLPMSAKKVGKLFNTYIMVELGDVVYLIDQHAAHEKILYDRISAEYEHGKVTVQHMLIPYDFTVNSTEISTLQENFDVLYSAGFEIAQSPTDENAFSMRSMPLCCVGLDPQSFINDFLKPNLSGNVLPDAFREKIMQAACKAAIKGEEDLSDIEIDSLLRQMSAEIKELFCPHGRPIAIKLKRQEIEKWFKRIV